MSLTQEQLSAIRLKARQESWKRNNAHEWCLDDGQKQLRKALYSASPLSSAVWLWGRQRGKTFAAIFLAIETCLTNKEAIVRYCAKTKDSALAIVMPTWEFLINTLPKELRPKKGKSEHEYIFPSTNSRFVLFGTDAQSFNKGRGPKSSLILLDECGFYNDFEQIEAALLPSLQTVGGKVVYLSTPAESIHHPYNIRIKAAEAAKTLFHDTFYNNPRVNHQKVIEEEAKRRGMTPEEFVKSTYFEREYLAKIVQEQTTAGMPSFNEAKAKEVTKTLPLPPYYDGYVSMDIGINTDPHAALFGVHDWVNDTLYILDELETPSSTTSIKNFVQLIKDKESILFGTNMWNGTILATKDWKQEYGGLPEYIQEDIRNTAPRQPYLRVTDNSQGVARDMTLDYGLTVFPTAKHEKTFNADRVNSALFAVKIIIHPRCTKLIAQLQGAQWNKTKTGWEHGIYMNGGVHHCDLVDCLTYMYRNMRWSRKDMVPLTPEVQLHLKYLPEAAKPAEFQKQTNLDSLKSVFRK